MIAPGPVHGSLLERDDELAALSARLENASAGLGSVVLIQGRAGVGKSALLARATGVAAGLGVRVLSARGSALEREFGLGVVRQLFEPLLHDHLVAEDLLTGAAAPAAALFGQVEEGAGGASFAALHALYWLTANAAAGQPLALAVDDLHWCDEASLRFVIYLARRLEGLPVALLASVRTTEPGAGGGLVGELAADPATLILEPAVLSATAAAQLIEERLGAAPEPRFAAACREATGGNPLLMRQLLTSLRAERVRPEDGSTDRITEVGAKAVSQLVLHRLSRLDPAAVAVARAVSVLGDKATAAHVGAIAGVPADAVAAAAAALTRLDVLRLDALSFVHPLVGDAVYHSLPAAERELAHAAAARLLLASSAPAPDVAAHLLQIDPGPQTAELGALAVLLDAAADADRSGSPESVAAYLRRALAEPEARGRADILLALGHAEALIADPAAAEHLRAARDLVEDPDAHAAATRALGQMLMFGAPVAEVGTFLAQALADTPADRADERMTLAALELISVYFGAPEWRRIRAERMVDRLPGTGPGARSLAAQSAFDLAMSGADARTAAALALDALGDDDLAAVDNGFFVVPATLVLSMADHEQATSRWERLLEAAQREGSQFGAATARTWAGADHFLRGDLREADTHLRAAVGDWRLWPHLRGADVYPVAFLARLRCEQGEPAAARALLSGLGQPPGAGHPGMLVLQAEAEVLLAENRAAAALAATDRLADEFAFLANPVWAPWRTLRAHALHLLDRTGEAVGVLEDALIAARAWGTPAAAGRVLRLLGTLQPDGGEARLREAVAVLEGSPARLELAKAHAGLGRALRVRNERTAARGPLREALDLAERCGATGLVEHVRTELYAAGARPRRTELRGVESLTTSERRVADIAATGQTNREIAQALFVTAKTVEMHLGNTYRKLDIRSRSELAAALSRD